VFLKDLERSLFRGCVDVGLVAFFSPGNRSKGEITETCLFEDIQNFFAVDSFRAIHSQERGRHLDMSVVEVASKSQRSVAMTACDALSKKPCFIQHLSSTKTTSSSIHLSSWDNVPLLTSSDRFQRYRSVNVIAMLFQYGGRIATEGV